MKRIFLFNCILFSLLIYSKSESSSNGIKSSDDEEIFVPESKWKEIKPGQAIPRGIHVRIDMTTGERQGKLMADEDEHGKVQPQRMRGDTQVQQVHQQVPATGGQQEDSSRLRLQAAFQKFLGDDPPPATQQDDDETNDEKRPPRFRSYEELKKILGEGNLEIKTDAEQLTTLLESWHKSESDSEISQLGLLHSLEDLVHKYDTAVTFVQMNGLTEMLLPALGNSSTPAVRSAALRALAASAQSNPFVQKAALEEGLLSQTLQLIRTEPLPELKAALYALGCLIRGQLESRNVAFGDNSDSGGGLAILADLYKRAPSLHTTLRTLIADLTKEDALFGERLSRANWCQQLTEDTRSIQEAESVLEAIEALENVCGEYFRSNEAQQLLLHWHLLLIDAEDEDTAQAVFKLIQRLRPRDEL